MKPLDAWLRDVVGRAGFSNVDEFVRRYDLRPYRLRQLYHAATKELLGSVDDVTTLPKDLRATLTEAGVSFSGIEPITLQHSQDSQASRCNESGGPRQRGPIVL